MEINQISDLDNARLCYKCHNLAEAHDGEMTVPEAGGIAGNIARNIKIAAGDETAYKFICEKCIRKIRLRKIIIWGSLIVAVGLVALGQIING